METYESILLVKPEVFVYKIPPRTSNRGYRAADWNLQEPTWTGRMRLVSKGTAISMKLEDKTSGALFANCPIETYPGVAVEAVTDSSRYFVIRIQDDNATGRSAFIGLGFGDRSDSFDLNVALQDHFKWVKNQEQIEKEKEAPRQELDLGFKEGETIKINMKITKKDGSESSSRTGKAKGASGVGILPPPPGVASKIAPPPGQPKVSPAASPSHRPAGQTEWGDFTSAGSQQAPQQPQQANSNWVQF
ncbi:NECAP-like protein CG9132 isoform X1 [Phlebotomus papatasi]|uniref:NECAP-like protein CG9132 isoform X1 n=1 Tax=Phlebotomus papatasi TaxID=29031 RepID=UPI002483B15D|nr:NECAP-like protein CG9132 isoform X1 [Phlebotomus papatasi]